MNFLAGTIVISSPSEFGIQLNDFPSLLARVLRSCYERFHWPALIVVFNSFDLFCPEICGRRLLETKPINSLLYYRWRVRKHFTTELSHTGRIQQKLSSIRRSPERFSNLLPNHPGLQT